MASPYLQLLLRGLGYGPAAVGLLLGLFEVVGIAGPLLVARAADRLRNYRPVLLTLALLVIGALVPLVLARRLGATIAATCLLSLGIKTLIPVMDAAGVSFLESRAGKGGYGRLRAFGSAGFVAMALLLQASPGFDRSPPWRIALVIALAAGAFCASLLLLPETQPMRTSSGGRPAGPGRRLDPVFLLGLAVIALSRLAMAPVSSFLSLYVAEELGWSAVGGLWALAAFSEIPLLLVSSRVVGRCGPMRVIALSSAAIAVRLAVFAACPSPAGVVAGQLLHSLGYGLFQPAAVAFVALRVPPERRAEGMAVFMGFGVGLPTFLGSALGGLVIDAWGYRVLFAASSLFALAAIGLWAAWKRRFAETTRGSRARARP